MAPSPADAAHGAPPAAADASLDAASSAAADAPGEAARRAARAPGDATRLQGLDDDQLAQLGADGADRGVNGRGDKEREERQGQQELHACLRWVWSDEGTRKKLATGIGFTEEN